jgi:hypothetical protein
MNRIRYRQWIDYGKGDGPYWRPWGFVKGKCRKTFIKPITLLGTYPESFQSTGDNDCNGNKIWRGSILQDDNETWVCSQLDNGLWVVFDKDGGWMSLSRIIEQHKATVIGDTMQNPELIEGELSDKAIDGINQSIAELDNPDNVKTFESVDECCADLDKDKEVEK